MSDSPAPKDGPADDGRQGDGAEAGGRPPSAAQLAADLQRWAREELTKPRWVGADIVEAQRSSLAAASAVDVVHEMARAHRDSAAASILEAVKAATTVPTFDAVSMAVQAHRDAAIAPLLDSVTAMTAAPRIGTELADAVARQTADSAALTSMWQKTARWAASNPIHDLVSQLQLLVWPFPDPEVLRREALPSNLAEADIAYDPDEWMGWISEGLVVAWVPDPGTLEAIAAAGTAVGRRTAVARRADDVLRCCDDLLDEITAVELAPFVAPTKQMITGFRAGFPELAQAYAANTLESMQMVQLGRGHYNTVRSQLDQADVFRDRLHLAQIEFVFRSYGKDIPTTFNRHATSHAAAGGKQYSRVNALLAISHLVSAMWKYELDTRDAHH